MRHFLILALLSLALTASPVARSVPPDLSAAAAQAAQAAADARRAAETLEKWRKQQSDFSILWPTVPAFLALLQSYLISRRQKQQEKDRQGAKQTTDAKLGEIHVLVNGRLSTALQEVEQLTAEVERLRQMHQSTAA